VVPNEQAAKVRERLSVNKRRKQQFNKQGKDLKKLYVAEGTEQFQFKHSNLCNSGYSGDSNIASVSVCGFWLTK
jgi:hypothetical protein